MFGFIKKLFGAKPVETAAPQQAAQAEVVVAVDPAVNPVVSTTSETVVVKEPAKKTKAKPAAKKPAGSKPAGNKKPRKPKATKA